MNEVKVKTHLIITDIHEEYHMNWCGKITDTKPQIENGKPKFVIRSRSMGSIEVATTDMVYLEDLAKRMTAPQGREALTSDEANIYIKQLDGSEALLGVLTHDRIKRFAPMYDTVYYR